MAREIGGDQKVENRSVQVDDAFRVIVTGDCGVGKTSILLRFFKDVFYYNPVAEVGYFEKFKKEVAVNGKPVELHIWDIANLLVSKYGGIAWQLVLFKRRKPILLSLSVAERCVLSAQY